MLLSAPFTIYYLSPSAALVILLSRSDPHKFPSLLVHACLSALWKAVTLSVYLQPGVIDTVTSGSVGRCLVIEISCGLCLFGYYKTCPAICLVTLHI